jgi:hypothetical protein
MGDNMLLTKAFLPSLINIARFWNKRELGFLLKFLLTRNFRRTKCTWNYAKRFLYPGYSIEIPPTKLAVVLRYLEGKCVNN